MIWGLLLRFVISYCLFFHCLMSIKSSLGECGCRWFWLLCVKNRDFRTWKPRNLFLWKKVSESHTATTGLFLMAEEFLHAGSWLWGASLMQGNCCRESIWMWWECLVRLNICQTTHRLENVIRWTYFLKILTALCPIIFAAARQLYLLSYF